MKVLGLVLMCGSLAAAQTVVEGDVINAATGAPLPGAHISDDDREEHPATRTDANGHFRLAMPDLAEHPILSLRIVYPGFLAADKVLVRRMLYTPGRPVSKLYFEMIPGASISGKVDDEEGFPVVGEAVNAMTWGTSNGRPIWYAAGRAGTDERGQYRLSRLPAGQYWILVDGEKLREWDERYCPAFFPGGRHHDDAHSLEIRAGEELGNVNVRMKKCEGVTVSGRIEAPGATQAMRWRDSSLMPGPDSDEPQSSRFSGVQRPDGSFVIHGVQPGDYTFNASAFPPKDAVGGNLWFVGKARVGEGGERNVVVKVYPRETHDFSGTLALAGTVTMEGGGKPIALQVVTLRNPGGLGSSAALREDGSFQIARLAPGHYSVKMEPDLRFMELDYGVVGPKSAGQVGYPVSVRLGGKEVLDTGFDLDETTAGPLQIKLSTHAIEIAGRVVDASGRPDFGRMVALRDEAALQGTTTTDAYGEFRARVRQPGAYQVCIIEEPHEENDPDYLKKHEHDFPILTLVKGVNPPVTLRLPTGPR